MKALQGGKRTAFLGFFASHIVFTVLMDGQAVLAQLYPQILRSFSDFYVTTFHDPLMGHPPLWLQSFICCELVLQLPFFIVACRFLSDSRRSVYPSWFRYACIAYGGHTATTLVPILATVWLHDHDLTNVQKMVLSGVYLPYFIFPLWILHEACTADVGTKSKTN